MNRPLLVIDVGNTSTTLGLYQAQRISHCHYARGGIIGMPELCHSIVKELLQAKPYAVVLGSVVPEASVLWRNLLQSEAELPLVEVTHQLQLDVIIDYPDPQAIGADRLGNACGGLRRYGVPLIVADFGTALTFDVITADRRYVGGVIAPGLPLMTDYLFERTALLPRVELSGECPKIGRTTQEAMRIGAQVGYRGIVREIYTYLSHSLDCDFKLVATGGYAGWALQDGGLNYTLDSDLTLFGFGCIGERNLN